jgi:hypothetical protein
MRVLIACSDASVRDAFLDALRQADIGVIPVANAAATLRHRMLAPSEVGMRPIKTSL